MKLHVIVIAFNRPVALRGLIDSFILQTRDDWTLMMIHDGPAPLPVKNTMKLYEKYNNICWLDTAGRMGNWGHHNRKAGIDMSMGDPGDFILITNDDNYYVPIFVEKMLEEAAKPKVGMVYCDFLHHNFEYDVVCSVPQTNHIDMGAFIVRLDIAKEIGFIHPEPHADGIFAEEVDAYCKNKKLRAVHIPKIFFIHN